MKANRTPGVFCALPWLHRFTNVGGEIQICCTGEEHFPHIYDDAGQPMNIATTSDDELIMNSTFMKSLRLKMLAGEWSSPCERCRITEEAGGMSRRHQENIAYSDRIDELVRTTASDGTIPVKVVSSDFRIGNLCNLTCRMCNPRSSIRWIPDWQKVKDNIFEMTPEMAEGYKKYDWYRSKATLEQLQKQLPTLQHLHFAGGEPLIVPEMLTFLRTCVESGHSKHIELTYNTNLTKIPAEAKSLWPHFAGVKLLCSIDGVGKVNDFIRPPSHWDSIDRNLRDIERNHEAYGIKEVLIMCTVQVYNVFVLSDLYEYLAQNFSFVTQLPYLVDLHFPDYFRTQILPPDLKAEALRRLQSVRACAEARLESGQIPARHRVALTSLEGAINFLGMEDLSAQVPRFVTVTESMDSLRRQATFSVLPELETLKSLAVL